MSGAPRIVNGRTACAASILIRRVVHEIVHVVAIVNYILMTSCSSSHSRFTGEALDSGTSQTSTAVLR